MAIHWNAYGQADGFAPKGVALWILPGVMLALFVLLAAVASRAGESARTAFDGAALATQVFLLLVHGMMLAIALGFPLAVERVVPFGISVLFVVLGFFMPGLTPNPVMGIRTPWTMRSPEVWRETHRFTGRLFVGGGLLLAVAAAVGASFWVVFSGFLLLGFVPVAYSAIVARRYRV
jgi:uncharacterized membrane protein